jgi:hypothetical protein
VSGSDTEDAHWEALVGLVAGLRAHARAACRAQAGAAPAASPAPSDGASATSSAPQPPLPSSPCDAPVPFVAGQLEPASSAANEPKHAVARALSRLLVQPAPLAAAPSNASLLAPPAATAFAAIPHAALVSSLATRMMLYDVATLSKDSQHFDGVSGRELGRRYYAAFRATLLRAATGGRDDDGALGGAVATASVVSTASPPGDPVSSSSNSSHGSDGGAACATAVATTTTVVSSELIAAVYAPPDAADPAPPLGGWLQPATPSLPQPCHWRAGFPRVPPAARGGVGVPARAAAVSAAALLDSAEEAEEAARDTAEEQPPAGGGGALGDAGDAPAPAVSAHRLTLALRLPAAGGWFSPAMPTVYHAKLVRTGSPLWLYEPGAVTRVPWLSDDALQALRARARTGNASSACAASTGLVGSGTCAPPSTGTVGASAPATAAASPRDGGSGVEPEGDPEGEPCACELSPAMCAGPGAVVGAAPPPPPPPPPLAGLLATLWASPATRGALFSPYVLNGSVVVPEYRGGAPDDDDSDEELRGGERWRETLRLPAPIAPDLDTLTLPVHRLPGYAAGRDGTWLLMLKPVYLLPRTTTTTTTTTAAAAAAATWLAAPNNGTGNCTNGTAASQAAVTPGGAVGSRSSSVTRLQPSEPPFALVVALPSASAAATPTRSRTRSSVATRIPPTATRSRTATATRSRTATATRSRTATATRSRARNSRPPLPSPLPPTPSRTRSRKPKRRRA